MISNHESRKKSTKRFIPNILTLLNMFLGFFSIVLILGGEPIKGGTLILFAAILDAFDGKVARVLGIDSQFGMEFDSLADTVSFCVVPSVLIYSLYVDGLPTLLGGFISFIPLMFGTIRLAKFNLEKSEIKSQPFTIGLTTPASTITLFAYLFFCKDLYGSYGDPRTALMLVASLGVLMVSPISFNKFPLLSFKSGKANSFFLVSFILWLILFFIYRGLVLFPMSLLYIGWNIFRWLTFSGRNSIQSQIDHSGS